MNLTLISPPTLELVSLDEAKTHLRVDGCAEDALIFNQIAAVMGYLDGPEGVLGRAIGAQTYDLVLPCFAPAIRLPLPPLQSVESVDYIDPAGSVQSVSDVQTYHRHGIGYICPAPGSNWPSTKAVQDAVTIRFTAGYTETARELSSLRWLALLLIGSAYKVREAEITGTIVAANPAIPRLLAQHKIAEFG